MDIGRAKVEDTVSGMVNRAIRWANEDGDGALLPVSSGDERTGVDVR